MRKLLKEQSYLEKVLFEGASEASEIATKNLKEITSNADIIISAVGKPNLVTSDMVKEGAVIIDVGISRIRDDSKKSGYRIVGDVDYENVLPKVSLITPVPGGVGPMTIASLIQNTLRAYRNNEKR